MEMRIVRILRPYNHSLACFVTVNLKQLFHNSPKNTLTSCGFVQLRATFRLPQSVCEGTVNFSECDFGPCQQRQQHSSTVVSTVYVQNSVETTELLYHRANNAPEILRSPY